MPLLCLLVAITSIQGGASLAKGLFPLVGAEGATALRTGIAALVMILFFKPWRFRISGQHWLFIALYGGSLGAMNLTFYKALERIPLGLAVALEFTGPLAVAFLGSRKKQDLLWATLATAGILLIVPHSTAGGNGSDLTGSLYALAAGAFWALYILTGRRASQAAPGTAVSALGMFFAAAVVFPFGIAAAGPRLIEPAVLPLALGVALLSSALPYTLEMVALRALPSHTFGILMSLEPAVAALSGLFFLNEHLTPAQWTAILLIIAASSGAALGAPRSATTSATELPA